MYRNKYSIEALSEIEKSYFDNRMKDNKKYVALLRGINVGGHHKVPMAALKEALKPLNFEQVITLLNSGNIIFESSLEDPIELEQLIEEKLGAIFGFPIPTIVRETKMIHELFNSAPFQAINVHKDIRLYISFLKNDVQSALKIPWKSDDCSFEILSKREKNILSVLDLSKATTPKAMGIIEKSFGKDITTRNWKTIERIVDKLQP